MSKKQIDLDAMRALAQKVPNGGCKGRHKYWNSGYDPACRNCDVDKLTDAINTQADEIEQLRKEQEFGVNANQDLMCELEMANAYIEQLRKERGALLAFIQGETDACTNSHLGGPCGQCTARRAALAAQRDKPHD